MGETEAKSREVCSRFAEIHWHDSKLLDLYLMRDENQKKYDLRLNLSLIVGVKDGAIERRMKTAVFKECRILRTELDLLGVLICGGDIASATCYLDAVELEKDRDRVNEFGFPQSYNPLEESLGFLIEMIHPGGEILVIAKDFELE